MAITFSDTTFVAGATLTAAQLNAVQAAIKAGSATIADNSITTAMLAAPHAHFTIPVPLNYNTAATVGGITSGIGLANNLTTIDFPFEVPTTCFLTAVTTSNVAAVAAGTTRDNDAVVRIDGADQATTLTTFATGAKTTTTLATAIQLAQSNTLLVRCNTDSAAGDGVCGGTMILHCRAVHISD